MIKKITFLCIIRVLIGDGYASNQTSAPSGRVYPNQPAARYRDIFPAAFSGDMNAVKEFISNGADPRAVDNYGFTVLHDAARGGNLDLVRYLVEEKGADPSAVNNDGATVLHLAAMNGNLNIVRYLVEEKGANPRAFVNDRRLSVLNYAEMSGNLELVRFLRVRIDVLNAEMSGNLDLVRSLRERIDALNAAERGATAAQSQPQQRASSRARGPESPNVSESSSPKRPGSDYTTAEYNQAAVLMRGVREQSQEGYLNRLLTVFSYDRAFKILEDVQNNEDNSSDRDTASSAPPVETASASLEVSIAKKFMDDYTSNPKNSREHSAIMREAVKYFKALEDKNLNQGTFMTAVEKLLRDKVEQ